MSRYSKQAISVLQDPNVDYRNLLFEIAKYRPKTLVDAASGMLSRKRETTSMKNAHLVKLIRDGKFVDAVKKYRLAARCSLKEAKDYCDNLRNNV